MSGIRVNEWLHNSGTGGIWQTSAGNVGIASSVPTTKLEVTGDAKISGVSTAAAFIPSGGQLSHRNLIINGAMKVAQYGTSQTSAGYGCVDRFNTSTNGNDEHPTSSQVDVTSGDPGPWEKGFRKALRITNGNQTGGAGVDDRIVIQYKIEAQDIANSGWDYTSSSSYITLSFWVKSHSVSQNFYGHFTSEDGTAQSYIFETGTLSAGTWKNVKVTIPGNSNITVDDNTAQGFYIEWVMFRGTNKTAAGKALNTWAAFDSSARVPDMTSTWYTTNDAQWEITGIQLEVGSVATPFEHRSYTDELIRCQRYYWKWVAGATYGNLGVGWAPNTTRFDTVISFPVTMRDTPTFSTGGSFRASTAATTVALTPTMERAGKSTAYLRSSTVSGLTAGQGGEYGANNDASAYVAFSAEL